MQTLYLATHFNPIYWNTSCLIVNSNSLDDDDDEDMDEEEIKKNKSARYDKIALFSTSGSNPKPDLLISVKLTLMPAA